MFVIEDERHADAIGEFQDIKSALEKLARLAKVPWDKEPNQAPCSNWKNCGREYEIIEYDNSTEPWQELRRTPILKMSANAVRWTPVARELATENKITLQDEMTETFVRVRKILLEDWDPIGVGDVFEAVDEYDQYVDQLLAMPTSEVSHESIENYLKMVVRDWMGLEPDEQTAKAVAGKLLPILTN